MRRCFFISGGFYESLIDVEEKFLFPTYYKVDAVVPRDFFQPLSVVRVSLKILKRHNLRKYISLKSAIP